MNVVLAGGGTAGHTSPLIATAEALRRLDPNVSLTCVGTQRGLEVTVIPAAGLTLRLIPAVPLPRRFSGALLTVVPRLLGAIRAARRILKEVAADVVVGFGGYVSLPVYLAAKTLRIPYLVHEQNCLPGLANRVATRWASGVFTTFPQTPLDQARCIGLPLRTELVELATDRGSAHPGAARSFGLAPDAPILLVSGGSQGAQRLNAATWAALPQLTAAGIQVIHVWGPKNYAEFTQRAEPVPNGYVPLPYVDDMTVAYAAADLMVGRSGAGTVIETAVVGLPAVFVPLPIGNGEQARNAASSVRAGAGILVADAELDATRLVAAVLPLLTDPAALQRMSDAGRALQPADAADTLARAVSEIGQKTSEGSR